MTVTPHELRRMSQSQLPKYWSEVSRHHLDEEDGGLGAICYAGMPAWFNRFLDRYQRKAFARLVSQEDFASMRVLDVGTGVGRWARWFARWPKARVTGIDIEPQRLALARLQGPSIDYLQMPANRLAFPDGSFDVINTVTVLQHVGHDVKREAIREFSRVLTPAGKAIVFEITDTHDDASHVFPWSTDTWVREFASAGLALERSTGDQYIPLIRLLKSGYRTIRGPEADRAIAEIKADSSARPRVMAPLRLAVLASYPVEEVVRFLPARLARITGFLFRKV